VLYLFGGYGLMLDALGHHKEVALVQVDIPLASLVFSHLDDQITLQCVLCVCVCVCVVCRERERELLWDFSKQA
jgi:hypothetical protein